MPDLTAEQLAEIARLVAAERDALARLERSQEREDQDDKALWLEERRFMWEWDEALEEVREAYRAMPSLLEMAGRALRVCDYCEKPLGGAGDNVCPACLGAELRRTDAAVARAEAAEADYEKARGVLLDALRNQGLLQNTATRGVVWHAHDCPASFDFAECNYRCRVAREAFALAGTEPYEVPPPCDCTPGDTCTCATDCDCRERDAHIWKYDAGWRNIEGLEETRRDTEVYE